MEVNIGEPVTFGEWLGSEDGGNFTSSQLGNLIEIDEHGKSSIMKVLYRDFTDQLMSTIESMGAP